MGLDLQRSRTLLQKGKKRHTLPLIGTVASGGNSLMEFLMFVYPCYDILQSSVRRNQNLLREFAERVHGVVVPVERGPTMPFILKIVVPYD